MMLLCEHHDVRTTLTFDPDVAALLEKENRRAKEPFKQTVNRLLRAGLHEAAKPVPRKPFVVVPFDTQLTSKQWENWGETKIEDEMLREAEAATAR